MDQVNAPAKTPLQREWRAVLSAIDVIEAFYRGKPCDSPAVSACVKCNAEYLARLVRAEMRDVMSNSEVATAEEPVLYAVTIAGKFFKDMVWTNESRTSRTAAEIAARGPGMELVPLYRRLPVSADLAPAIHPLDDWHEDDSYVLWWKFPIVEPPYVGSPLCSDWPGYHTHWGKIPIPADPTETAGKPGG